MAAALAAMLQIGYPLDNPAGIAVLAGIYLLAALVAWRRSVHRTVRPRYFSPIFTGALIWVGIAFGAAPSVVADPDGGPPSMAVSVLAGLVVAAPIFACGLWLMVRRP